MSKLQILAVGKSLQAQAQARGKLFEELMSKVLRHLGFKIDRIASTNYAGMEIDIEGEHIVTGIPLYAECKYRDKEVESRDLQQFFGKYMTLWFKDNRCQGLFIALPGVNSHAKGFYEENLKTNARFTVRLYDEDQVLKTIIETDMTVRPEVISSFITEDMGTPGDWSLLYTDNGLFWVQYVIPLGSGIPSRVALFDSRGNLVASRATIDYLTQLLPDLSGLEVITSTSKSFFVWPYGAPQEEEEIVEVRGSSECFEYQFPASPEHFVGRQDVLRELDSFVRKVINKETSSRGILFEANSGWGKSSVVLASVDRLRKMGHFAIAIDSRTAASSQFILRVINYVLKNLGDFGKRMLEGPTTITGFDGATQAILRLGRALEENDKVMCIFLDQFENVFSLPEALKRITDMLLKVCDAQTNIIFGFSWKTDLVGLTSDFPYRLRDTIKNLSKHIPLERFSEVETNALLDRLSNELRAPLRKDLRFLLSEFSQGYPWLLKKLCAHVKAQRENGVSQLDIANGLLNVEELFQEDMRGLSPEEEEALRLIARKAPIAVSELGEELRHEVVQSLVHRRLVVKIGPKFDVYWDIFRDYLISGHIPAQENYILRTQIGSVLKAIRLLFEANGTLDIPEFLRQAGLSEKSFLNVARDMKLLGLARVEGGKISLQVSLPREPKSIEEELRPYLRERLRRNRLVRRLLDELETKDCVTLDEVASHLSNSCPYISATMGTWRTYARNLANWMDVADLAIFNFRNNTLTRYHPRTEIRERNILLGKLGKRRGGATIPCIQYRPLEKAVIRIAQAVQNNTPIDWAGFKKSTRTKVLITLEDLGFISRKAQSIELLPRGLEFASNPERRPKLFAEGALQVRAFTAFVEVLQECNCESPSLKQLAMELKFKLGANWKESTAVYNTKIMLDWARHANLIPTNMRVGRKRGQGSTNR